jgi:hypothetical protein
VDEGNGKFNLMLLCWGEGHSSAVHDHADAHCFMKMLDGTLNEVRFAWPSDGNSSSPATTESGAGDAQELQTTGSTLLEVNGVCYINGNQTFIIPFQHFVEGHFYLSNRECIETFVDLIYQCKSRPCRHFYEITTETRRNFWLFVVSPGQGYLLVGHVIICMILERHFLISILLAHNMLSSQDVTGGIQGSRLVAMGDVNA